MKKIQILVFLLAILNTVVLANETDSRKDIVIDVYSKLLNFLEAPDNFDWPPILELTADTAIYAYSVGLYNEKADKIGLKVIISQGIINKLINDDTNILAFILSHELAHITLGHLTENLNYKTGIIKRAISISDEYKADLEGLKIAIDAGFQNKKIINSLKKLALSEYQTSGFECLSKVHPAWDDRLSYIDTARQNLWKMLSTFKNGAAFLSLNQYEPAIFCFQNVIDQFPGCWEAHANLGYARLMNYIELLEPEDFIDFNISPIVSGGFYNHSESIASMIRGADIELWWDAVGELKLSLKLMENQPLVEANLGLAYLVSPLRNIDAGKSAEYLSKALEKVETDINLNDLQKACIYLNAGVSYAKKNEPDSVINNLLILADNNIKKFGEFNGNKINLLTNGIGSAIKYNQAVLLMKIESVDSLNRALKLFEEYLNSENPASPWYNSAYQAYKTISDELKSKVMPYEYFTTKNSARQNKQVVGIRIGAKNYIHLSDQKKKVMDQLASYSFIENTIIPGKNLKRVKYRDLGIDLLATDYVFAIILNKKHSPEILLTKTGPESTGKSIKTGMSLANFELNIGSMEYTDNVRLVSVSDSYRFYPELGIAVKINPKSKIIDEIVIAKCLE